ncbi:CBS domain-containing protein [Nocardia huaxiensis]|uniref:CBS domain-containing protein n=1 Tax=Nocardia huaxiensis TaxID=2755382 RepID=A0A7D6ZBU2_9NOCA|nr:CBS domain-containing protein [Nocardia huaxiensis]QLY29898.1 CBS domain-containing protein [Nocardia huaxiensis]UFS96513.1 CBS domain-containing protein [Nocardia huaxiensis]
MHAAQMAEEYPVIDLDSDAMDAARLLAEHRLPGILVTDGDGAPRAVLPASTVVLFIVPKYVQDDPSLAGVLNESMCSQVSNRLRGKKVRDVIPERLSRIPAAQADDNMIEVAALMAKYQTPLVAVQDGQKLLGVITASRLLEVAVNN